MAIAVVLLASVVAVAVPANGQTTNRQVLEQVGVQCLADAAGEIPSFRLAAPDSLPYLRSALVHSWLAGGKRVLVEDASEADVPLFRYGIQQAGVSYRRIGRSAFERTVSLSLEYTLTGIQGSIEADGICNETAVDTVRTRDLALLEDPAFSETVGPRPPAGWIRRIVEPAVLVGAVSVGVYLFFSLRSTSGAE